MPKSCFLEHCLFYSETSSVKCNSESSLGIPEKYAVKEEAMRIWGMVRFTEITILLPRPVV